MFELWPSVRLLWKPTGELEYVSAAAWAQAVCPAGQSTAKPNARLNLPAKIDIRTAAKCPEIIPSGYQEGQRRAAGRANVTPRRADAAPCPCRCHRTRRRTKRCSLRGFARANPEAMRNREACMNRMTAGIVFSM